MSVKWKQINILLLLYLSTFIMIPNVVLASEDSLEKGKLKIKTDRILENDSNLHQEIRETELEKTFPELFTEETAEKFEYQKTEDEAEVSFIKEQIFSEELPSSTAIYEVKSELFTEEYQPQQTIPREEDEESNEPSSLFVYGSIVSFIGMMLGGVFLVARNWGG